ncbi:seipin isoform X2 [Sitophilus oryzae]|uniref:Seipin n=1 Tax=Sitophilus oryzae TaxID=7048 RepID=A0A6J2YGA3_SITOR|nr:seipin isoform X2 [Sitophilus oryzae]
MIFSMAKCIFRLGPREYVKQRIKLPIIKFIHDSVSLYKTRTKNGVHNLRDILLRGAIIAFITSLLVWLSIFMYLAFYYVYVPTLRHERPVHLKFKPCGTTYDHQLEKGMCSFPSAYVQLTSRQQLLMMGQPYRISLDLEMPESPVNKELGMFMVCVDFKSSEGKTIANSCRSTMLHYRSLLLDSLYKLFYIPFFIFGSTEEKQNIHVELFSDYKESEYEPVTDIFIEIQTKHIEIYSAKFSVNAEFSGLRYVMFNYPVLSATFGISSNLFFIALVCLINWYQIINSDEYLQYVESQKTVLNLNNEEYNTDSDSSEGSYLITGVRKRRQKIEEIPGNLNYN